jgi:hypothetical protein
MREITIDGVRYELHPVEEPPKSIIVPGVSTFEVSRDIARPMSWYNAMQWCEDLGNGWRLPTRAELLMMYEHRDAIGGLESGYYWSSSEGGSGDAWVQSFSSGYQFSYYEGYSCRVRAVRTAE